LIAGLLNRSKRTGAACLLHWEMTTGGGVSEGEMSESGSNVEMSVDEVSI
jgi:hypothetical protein